ncbi:MAG TPA: cyclase family protein [Pyrinomonadaceae bacterium]|nr:cyclase family protein [Pyrinomonadaceae bacterium]
MKFKFGLLLLIALVAIGFASRKDFPNGEWIDLSYDFSAETIYWTTDDGFRKETVAEGKTPQGYYYSSYKISTPEHGGTHLDAPIHFAENGRPADRVPLTDLIGPAVKIDISVKASADRDYAMTVNDVAAWEKKNGRIPDGAIVLIQTGYGKFWPDRTKYMGLEGEVKHFPSLGPDAARWLVANRKIRAAGIDTASIDVGVSTTFETHVALMTKNVPAFENVANMDKLPEKGFQIVALPMKIKDGSGGPLRIVAFLPE